MPKHTLSETEKVEPEPVVKQVRAGFKKPRSARVVLACTVCGYEFKGKSASEWDKEHSHREWWKFWR